MACVLVQYCCVQHIICNKMLCTADYIWGKKTAIVLMLCFKLFLKKIKCYRIQLKCTKTISIYVFLWMLITIFDELQLIILTFLYFLRTCNIFITVAVYQKLCKSCLSLVCHNNGFLTFYDRNVHGISNMKLNVLLWTFILFKVNLLANILLTYNDNLWIYNEVNKQNWSSDWMFNFWMVS